MESGGKPSSASFRVDFDALGVQAASVFTPHAPVNTMDLFAGRSQQIELLAECVAQGGIHSVVYGERGVGKTSLANIVEPLVAAIDRPEGGRSRVVVRVGANAEDSFSSLWLRMMEDVAWEEEFPRFGFTRSTNRQTVTLREHLRVGDELTIDGVRRILGLFDRPVVVIDEFDRLAGETRAQFTDFIKALSDYSARCTLIVVGVAETLDELLHNHASIHRALIQIPMPRMSAAESLEILRKGEERLRVTFEPASASRIAAMSQGLPHYTHHVALHAVRSACDRQTVRIGMEHVQDAFARVAKRADRTLRESWEKATRSPQAGARFEKTLIACAICATRSADASGLFQPASVANPLAELLGRASVEIAAYNNHLKAFTLEQRGCVLTRVGQERAFRYRFRDPFLPPFIIMLGVAEGIVAGSLIDDLLSERE